MSNRIETNINNSGLKNLNTTASSRLNIKSIVTNINGSRINNKIDDINLSMPNNSYDRYVTRYNSTVIVKDEVTGNGFVKVDKDGNVFYMVDGEPKSFPILENETISEYVNIDRVKEVNKNGNEIDITFTNGSVIHVYEGDTSYVSGNDSEGRTTFGYVINSDGSLSNISIYGDYTRINNQYGGNQIDLRNNVHTLLGDERIYQMLENYFPGSTYWEKASYITSLSHAACGFVGEINGLFQYYEGREQEFKDRFGFDMYTINSDGTLDFNYEYLILEFYTYGVARDGLSMYDVINDSEGFASNKSSYFHDFLLDNYGLEANCSNYYDPDNPDSGEALTPIFDKEGIINKYYELVEQGNESIMIGSWGYYLRDYDTGGISYYSVDGEGHAMTVLGEENGNLIVSSWGKKYILDLDYMDNFEYRYSYFYTVDYE